MSTVSDEAYVAAVELVTGTVLGLVLVDSLAKTGRDFGVRTKQYCTLKLH